MKAGKTTFRIFIMIQLFASLSFAGGVNFNALIEESNNDRSQLENKYKAQTKSQDREYAKPREVVKFESEEEAQVINVKSQVDLEHHQKQAKKKIKKNMAVEVQSLEEEIANVPED